MTEAGPHPLSTTARHISTPLSVSPPQHIPTAATIAYRVPMASPLPLGCRSMAVAFLRRLITASSHPVPGRAPPHHGPRVKAAYYSQQNAMARAFAVSLKPVATATAP